MATSIAFRRDIHELQTASAEVLTHDTAEAVDIFFHMELADSGNDICAPAHNNYSYMFANIRSAGATRNLLLRGQ